jgi:hypothetical protein
LTTDEISEVLGAITKVTCKGSVLVTTWIGEKESFPGKISMHVSRTDSPEQHFDDQKWQSCGQKKSIGEIAMEHWTVDNISPGDKSYHITCHERQ